MANTLQQIKDEYANEQGRDSWDEFFSWNELTHTGIDRMQYHHDQVAIRYAQEQNRELLEMLIMINEGIHTMDFTQLEHIQPEIEQLIKSATEG